MSEKEQKKEFSFEEAMDDLEKIVERLEEGDVPLEESIRLFQKGMKRSKQCHDKLQAVEKQMDQLIDENGQVKSFVFQEEDTRD
jgi:exodeoxyribonuclease VII small subunit